MPGHYAPVKPQLLTHIDTLRAGEARNTADSHLLTALEQQVDNMIKTVRHYPCRHQWKIELARQVCDACGRKTNVLYVSFVVLWMCSVG